MKARCPVCFRRDCKVEHRDCSPDRAKGTVECVICGNPMRERVADGLCGFCREELAGRRAA